MEAFYGKWNCVASDNFEAYMKEVGVGQLVRDAIVPLKSTFEFKLFSEGTWTFTVTSGKKTHTTKFRLDVPVEEMNGYGKAIINIFHFEDNKLIQEEFCKADKKKTVFTRAIVDGKLVCTGELNKTKFVRTYEKSAE